MKQIEINSRNGKLEMPDLPHNCIFNKVVTGCGGTTIALTNNENYVIAVPTTDLIVNKTRLDDYGESKVTILGIKTDIFGVFNKKTKKMENELKDYISKDGIKKIMCTYDKLPYITSLIDKSEYRLLVDEYHRLLKDYSYRDIAINGVLNNFRGFKSFCFMSATPINVSFKPDCLSDVEEYVADWNYTDKVKVKLIPIKNPYLAASKIVDAYLTGNAPSINGVKSDMAYFFINSVKDIKKILDNSDVPESLVRIVCADTDTNRKKIGKYKIGTSKDKEKMFNFLTCKAFEGSDFYGENAISYVVSYTSNPYTQVSVDTDIPQIAGRIRNQSDSFKKLIIHITNYSFQEYETSYEDVEKGILNRLELTKKKIEYINNADDDIKNDIINDYKDRLNEYYMYYDGTQLMINDIRPKLDLYEYKVRNIAYSSGLNLAKAYYNNDVELDNSEKYEDNTVDEVTERTKKESFKDKYYRVLEMITKKEYFGMDNLYKEEPLLRDAVEKLSEDDLKSVRFTKKGVKEMLTSKDLRLNNNMKVMKILYSELQLRQFISNDEIKSAINKAYRLVGIEDKAKASDIKKWFDANTLTKKIDGKVTRGYML